MLAFDYGLQRIGVAVGNTITATASPEVTLRNRDNALLWNEVDRLIDDWRPVQLLVGQPENLNDSSKALLKEIGQFSQQLVARFDLPVSSVDEQFSSREAQQRLISQRRQGRKQKIKKHEIDQQAAVIILERWLQAL